MTAPNAGWLAALRAYLAVILVLSLIWETAQLPLYTIWNEGTAGGRVLLQSLSVLEIFLTDSPGKLNRRNI